MASDRVAVECSLDMVWTLAPPKLPFLLFLTEQCLWKVCGPSECRGIGAASPGCRSVRYQIAQGPECWSVCSCRSSDRRLWAVFLWFHISAQDLPFTTSSASVYWIRRFFCVTLLGVIQCNCCCCLLQLLQELCVIVCLSCPLSSPLHFGC